MNVEVTTTTNPTSGSSGSGNSVTVDRGPVGDRQLNAARLLAMGNAGLKQISNALHKAGQIFATKPPEQAIQTGSAAPTSALDAKADPAQQPAIVPLATPAPERNADIGESRSSWIKRAAEEVGKVLFNITGWIAARDAGTHAVEEAASILPSGQWLSILTDKPRESVGPDFKNMLKYVQLDALKIVGYQQTGQPVSYLELCTFSSPITGSSPESRKLENQHEMPPALV